MIDYLNYKGSVTGIPSYGTLGDTISINDDIYVHNGSDWVGLNIKPSPIYVDTVASYYPPKITKLENCHNCGGTVDENGYCKYCGSRVYMIG